MATNLHTQSNSVCNGGPQPATVFDVDVVSCMGSVALLPRTKDAKSYCELALSGWCSAHGVYFVPRQSADLILRLLTQRFACRVDGEMVS
jgi:hypothetical protein